MWAGVIGMITGSAGAMIGILSHRKVSKMKSLDLRLDVKTEHAVLANEFSVLAVAEVETLNTHRSQAITLGTVDGSTFNRQRDRIRSSFETIRETEQGFNDLDPDFASMNLADLEGLLINIRIMSRRLRTNKHFAEKLIDS